MITLDGFPRNQQKYRRLLDYFKEILGLCRGLGVDPIVDGSLAVFAYTKNQDIEINDIDLACLEGDFTRVMAVFDANGMNYRLREWHVLQVIKDDLRVELGSIEYWYRGLPIECATLQLGDSTVRILSLGTLRALYQQGLDDTAKNMDEGNNRLKNESYRAKCDLLSSVSPTGGI